MGQLRNTMDESYWQIQQLQLGKSEGGKKEDEFKDLGLILVVKKGFTTKA